MTTRLVARPAGRASTRLGWSTLDQALSSGGNFLLVFLLARNSTADEFGLLMIGYTLATVGISASRNAFGGILGMDLPRLSAANADALVSRSLTAAVLTGLPVSAVLAAYAFLLPVSADGRNAVLILAVAMPLVLVQDLQRFWAVALGAPIHAVLADFVWVVTASGGLWVPMVAPLPASASLGAMSWSAGGLLGCLILVGLGYRRTLAIRGMVGWLRKDVRRLHLASDSLLSSGSPFANSAILAVLGGPQVVAALRGAGTLFGPLNLLSATFPLALVPEALRAGPQRAQWLFRIAAAGFGIVAAAWGVTLYLLPTGVGTALLGDSWDLVHPVVLITALEYVGLGVWSASRSRFRVQNRLRTALRLRIAFSIATLVVPIIAFAVWDSTKSAAGGLAATSLTFAAVAWVISRHKSGRTTRPQ